MELFIHDLFHELFIYSLHVIFPLTILEIVCCVWKDCNASLIINYFNISRLYHLCIEA